MSDTKFDAISNSFKLPDDLRYVWGISDDYKHIRMVIFGSDWQENVNYEMLRPLEWTFRSRAKAEGFLRSGRLVSAVRDLLAERESRMNGFVG